MGFLQIRAFIITLPSAVRGCSEITQVAGDAGLMWSPCTYLGVVSPLVLPVPTK